MRRCGTSGGRASVLWAVLLVLAGAVAGCGRGGASASGQAGDDAGAQGGGGPPSGGAPPALVRVAEARQQEMQTRWDATGRLAEMRRAVVAAEVAGKVLAVAVEEGDRVEAGRTVLAEIDGVWSRLALESAEATIKSIEARLAQSRRELAYLEELARRGSATTKEVDDARSLVQSQEAELQAAVAERNRQQERVDRLKVLAPFDGAVVAKLTEVGQWVSEGSPIVELITTGKIDAVIDVPERLIAQISLGDRVPMLIEPLSLEVEGEVVSVIPWGSNAARTFPVKIRLGDRGGELKPGMSVIAYVPMGRRRSYLSVPRDAVQFSPQGAVVWTPQQAEGPMPVAAMVPVQVVLGQGDWFAIEPVGAAALADGQAVVVEGAESLFPGRALIVAGGGPGPGADAAAMKGAR